MPTSSVTVKDLAVTLGNDGGEYDPRARKMDSGQDNYSPPKCNPIDAYHAAAHAKRGDHDITLKVSETRAMA